MEKNTMKLWGELNPGMINDCYGIYTVSESKPYLAGMPFPDKGKDIWEILYGLGIKNVVCLTSDRMPYDPAPVKPFKAVKLEDLYGNRSPSDGEKELEKIMSVAGGISKMLLSGESVVVHCIGGTGRTGTVIAATLGIIGYGFDEVKRTMEMINEARGRAGSGWPESEWQMEVIRKSMI